MMPFTYTTTDPRRKPSVIVCVGKQLLEFAKLSHLMLNANKYYIGSVFYLQIALGRRSLRELCDVCHHNR